MTETKYEIGVLKQIRFQNDNGFLIGMFGHQDKRGTFSALGNLIRPEIGLAYKLFGNWESNGAWGNQYKFNFYETLQPSDTKGIFQYLVRSCKWVGPTVAGRIVSRYQESTLDVLKNTPETVAAEIQGLTMERAMEIQEKLRENEHVEKVLVELERLFASISGLRKSLPMELVAAWKSNAVIRLRENPYALTQFAGIGFPTADKIALALGFDRNSMFRAHAAIRYILMEEIMLSGSVWMALTELKERMKDLTGIASWTLPDDVVTRDQWAAMAETSENESYIAEKISKMVGGE